MTALGPVTFGVPVWGSIVGVFCVFLYELFVRTGGRDRFRGEGNS